MATSTATRKPTATRDSKPLAAVPSDGKAKRGRKPGTKNMALDPVIDFHAVTVESSKAPLRSRREGNSLDKTPFVAWLTASNENDETKAIVVPNGEAVRQAKYFIRAAGTRLGLGARIVETELDNGQTRIEFRAQPKRARKSKGDTADSTVVTGE
jgi:hypothetical protein